MSDTPQDSLSLSTFDGRQGESFAIRAEQPSDLRLELAEVNRLGGDSDTREPFGLIFLGPLDPILSQATYTLEHEQLGAIDLFLVPVGPNKEETAIQYEAVFS